MTENHYLNMCAASCAYDCYIQMHIHCFVKSVVVVGRDHPRLVAEPDDDDTQGGCA